MGSFLVGLPEECRSSMKLGLGSERVYGLSLELFTGTKIKAGFYLGVVRELQYP